MLQPHRAHFNCVCFLLLFICAGGVQAQQGSNTLQGKVILPNGTQPRNSVRVRLTFSGRRLFETFTDLAGSFTFTGLASGTYQLTAESDGELFDTTSVAAEVFAFGGAPQTFTQNIQLRVKPGATLPPAATVSAEELDPSIPARARELYQKGRKSAVENKPEQAIKALQEAVALHPPFYGAHLTLGEQCAKLQRYEEALAAYRRASELQPERPEPYIGVGVTLVSQKQYAEGIAMLRRIVELDEKLAAPYLSLGYAEMMTGEQCAAEKHLLRALELTKATIAHVYLANVYEQLGEPAHAVEQLQAYLKENPQTPNAESIRGAIEKLRKQQKH
jgi:tetratricopeptide (TPR) repeat protein